LVITDGPLAKAAKIRARFVSDLEPGIATVAVMGAGASGAGHCRSSDTPQILGILDHHHRVVRISAPNMVLRF